MKRFTERILSRLHRCPEIECEDDLTNFYKLKKVIENIDTFDSTPLLFRTPSCKGYKKVHIHKAIKSDTKTPIIVFDLYE